MFKVGPDVQDEPSYVSNVLDAAGGVNTDPALKAVLSVGPPEAPFAKSLFNAPSSAHEDPFHEYESLLIDTEGTSLPNIIAAVDVPAAPAPFVASGVAVIPVHVVPL